MRFSGTLSRAIADLAGAEHPTPDTTLQPTFQTVQATSNTVLSLIQHSQTSKKKKSSFISSG